MTGALIKVEIGNDEITQALKKLSNSGGITSSILDQIGEYLIDSTKQRFRNSTGPDGKRWAPNTKVTILRVHREIFRQLHEEGQYFKAWR
jgi:hypothetical protein